MVTKLRRVGNSRGVILPAPFLNALSLHSEVEIRLEGTQIILEAPAPLRKGWYEGFAVHEDQPVWDEGTVLSPDEDWEW